MSIIMVSVFELGWRWESVGHNYNYEHTMPAIGRFLKTAGI